MAATVRAWSVGKLETFPLTDLLVFLVEQRATGTLVLQERGGRKSAFYFYLGAAVKGHTPAILTAHSSGTEAVAQHLEWAAGLGGTTAYGFYPGVDYLHRLRPSPANPLAQIWRLARRSVNPTRVNEVISNLGDRPLALNLRSDLGRFCFSWEEVAAVELLRSGRHTFNDLLATYDGDTATLCKLVCVLVLCRHIDIPGRGDPVGVEGPETIVAPRLPPPGSIPAEASQPRPYRSSQPPPRATSGTKRQVKAQASSPPSRRLHPSLSPTPTLAEPATSPPRSGARSSASPSSGVRSAETALPRSRPCSQSAGSPAPAPSSRTPQGGVHSARPSNRTTQEPRSVRGVSAPHDPTIETAAAREGTADAWSRAEQLAKTGRFSKALELVQDRYRPEWNNADRGAFVAYLKARGGVLGADEGIQMLEACSKAVMENPDEPRYRFFRAWVYKSLGRECAALMDFVQVAQEDPTNVDAAREIHLARKRRLARVSSSGLIDRLKRSLTPTPKGRQEVVITSRPVSRVKPR